MCDLCGGVIDGVWFGGLMLGLVLESSVVVFNCLVMGLLLELFSGGWVVRAGRLFDVGGSWEIVLQTNFGVGVWFVEIMANGILLVVVEVYWRW